MAHMPVEVAVMVEAHAADVAAAMDLANAAQDEFVFVAAESGIQARLAAHVYAKAETEEMLDLMERSRSEARGYHPFILAVSDSFLVGPHLSNLFGAHRAERGLAIVTTANVVDSIIPANRMAAYYLYFLGRYTLGFLAPRHETHATSRGCVFDLKADKRDLLLSMRPRAVCDLCRVSLLNGYAMLSPGQLAAVDKIVALSGRVLTDGGAPAGRPRVFVGSSFEGLDVADKLQELLSDEFSVVVWNQGTVFGLGDATLEALEAAVLDYDFGVFVFTPDDTVTSRGQTKGAARDNVLFELGMFIGRLGRRKAFVVHPGNAGLGIPSDLAGILLADYRPQERDLAAALGRPASMIRMAIRQALATGGGRTG